MKALFGLLLAFCVVSSGMADDHAVVLVYHHVSENTPALTSVTPAVFDSHLDYLQENGFSVWPLARILESLKKGEALPENTVAITFDDAYRSIYTEAFPRLRKRNWPFTLFVSSEAVDRGYDNYLSWAQLRELADSGVELGNHSHSHAHLLRRLQDESEAQWRQRVIDDIDTAARRLQRETGSRSRLFAYPYGEYSPGLKAIVETLGYLGIAQQSGAVGAVSDFLAVPRFPMAQGYADLRRFATSVNARPLPVSAVTVDAAASSYQPIASLQLTLDVGDYQAQQLACYRATGTPLMTRPIAAQPLTLSIALSGDQSAGRHKINCTAPARHGAGVYYWYSYQWLVKKSDGSWYRE
jgi:peptidoglycan/xylan/chitin deacetylase (PgdA/CDA1 family)